MALGGLFYPLEVQVLAGVKLFICVIELQRIDINNPNQVFKASKAFP